MLVVVQAWAVLSGAGLVLALAAVASIGGVEVVHRVDGDVLVVGLSTVVTGRAAVVLVTTSVSGGRVDALGIDGGSCRLTNRQGAEAGGVEKDEGEAEDGQLCNIRGPALHVQTQQRDDSRQEHEDEERDHGQVENGDLDKSGAGGLGDGDALERLEKRDCIVENEESLKEDDCRGGVREATFANDANNRDGGDQPPNAIHEGRQNGDEDGDIRVVCEGLVGLLALDTVDQFTPHGHLEAQRNEWEEEREVIDSIPPGDGNLVRRKGNRKRQVKASRYENHVSAVMLTILLDSLDNKRQHPNAIRENKSRQDIQPSNENNKPDRPPHMIPRAWVLLDSRQEDMTVRGEEGSHGDDGIGTGVRDVEEDLVVPFVGIGELSEGGSEIFHAGGVAVHDDGTYFWEGQGGELGVECRQFVEDLIMFAILSDAVGSWMDVKIQLSG